MDSKDDTDRLRYLIDLIDREDAHLLAVRSRFLGHCCDVDAQRMQSLLSDDVGVDRLESFGAKFGRMQDTVMDKFIPVLLRLSGERVVAAIDNLGKMERLCLIESADAWLQMRNLRNRLVHEYFDRPADMAPALERACRFTDVMHADYQAMREYAQSHFAL
ncbi:hypothetical protein PC39_08169 [Salinisphaera sp. PC39]|uniref:hypothetical protein n=1 Tax=Salinisphaera sp. PC39 TaxID=1304156 RepID=UPI0033421E10